MQTASLYFLLYYTRQHCAPGAFASPVPIPYTHSRILFLKFASKNGPVYTGGGSALQELLWPADSLHLGVMRNINFRTYLKYRPYTAPSLTGITIINVRVEVRRSKLQ